MLMALRSSKNLTFEICFVLLLSEIAVVSFLQWVLGDDLNLNIHICFNLIFGEIKVEVIKAAGVGSNK